MTLINYIGAGLLSIPFIMLISFMMYELGWKESLFVLGVIIILNIFIWAAVYLLMYNH